ncbi:2-phospho-L-lactate guanylyltransferase [Iamia sp. SCSIO 61187]|uniref:2-phospho-L-lactate guanylyltransferase n=1 Tax=Iamia sp. SCSIO 61187 TaxID=2722752 RepID=UPI001C62579D|nr:2-phospho-L-lactate guanylyltransferase [Iamia sp. SCSIO 61187]QYG92007.1 2-phospho-L-lactate guanylyltransferase [Iamia sp. SCSIO 61187]
MGAAVVIPVKAFHAAKGRLATALDPAARAALARSMAEQVIHAAAPLPVTVVCDDTEVATWARGLGVAVAWTPGLGLDGAVEAGVRTVEAAGATRVVVAHADLPLARGLASLAQPGEREPTSITLVPDRHGDGTNVVVLPAGCGFRFAYGPGSFGRHRAEAARLGLAALVVNDPRLGWDVDLPADLVLPTDEDLAAAAACAGDR